MWEEKCFYYKKTSYIILHCPHKKALEIKTLEEKKEISDKNQNLKKALF